MLLTILIAAILVIIIDSYWPMLYNIYSAINELTKNVYNEFTEFHNYLNDAFSDMIKKIQKALKNPSIVSNGDVKIDREPFKFKVEKKHYCLGCWVIICVIASF
jgi:hypothetical protein